MNIIRKISNIWPEFTVRVAKQIHNDELRNSIFGSEIYANYISSCKIKGEINMKLISDQYRTLDLWNFAIELDPFNVRHVFKNTLNMIPKVYQYEVNLLTQNQKYELYCKAIKNIPYVVWTLRNDKNFKHNYYELQKLSKDTKYDWNRDDYKKISKYLIYHQWNRLPHDISDILFANFTKEDTKKFVEHDLEYILGTYWRNGDEECEAVRNAKFELLFNISEYRKFMKLVEDSIVYSKEYTIYRVLHDMKIKYSKMFDWIYYYISDILTEQSENLKEIFYNSNLIVGLILMYIIDYQYTMSSKNFINIFGNATNESVQILLDNYEIIAGYM